MNVFSAALDAREFAQNGTLADAEKSAESWQLLGDSPEARLLAFDRWVRIQLEKTLVWPEDRARRVKMIAQCRAELERALIEMFDRGWLLDGKRLARHVSAMLAPIGEAQRKGSVGDFWPYFSASVRRYPRMNAEAIQREAKSVGALAGMTVAALMQAASKAAPATGDLILQRRDESLKERLKKRRDQESSDAADRAQLPLF